MQPLVAATKSSSEWIQRHGKRVESSGCSKADCQGMKPASLTWSPVKSTKGLEAGGSSAVKMMWRMQLRRATSWAGFQRWSDFKRQDAMIFPSAFWQLLASGGKMGL